MAFSAKKFTKLELNLVWVRKYGIKDGSVLSLIDKLAACNHACNFTKAYRDGRWCAVISTRRIAQILGYSICTIGNTLRHLQEEGVLIKHRYGGAIRMYAINERRANQEGDSDNFDIKLITDFM